MGLCRLGLARGKDMFWLSAPKSSKLVVLVSKSTEPGPKLLELRGQLDHPLASVIAPIWRRPLAAHVRPGPRAARMSPTSQQPSRPCSAIVGGVLPKLVHLCLAKIGPGLA